MKIANINTHDSGGAGRAALRLNKSLNLIGEDSCLFVKNKSFDNDSIIQINSPEVNNKLFEDLATKYFYKNIRPGNTISSIMYPSIGFRFLDIFQYFDVVNLHWISSFISIEAIMKIRSMGKPVIWTLHDQNPFTGGCHYSNGCDKYKMECNECPQLVNNEFNITKDVMAAKLANLPKDITIVTPSKWMASCARESALFKNYRIEVIPNSVELDIYKQYNKCAAKNELGLAEDAKVILFGAQELNEERKGLKYLLDSIKYLKEDRYIQKLIDENKLCILAFGNQSPILDQIGIPAKALGYIGDDVKLAKIYSAADVLALPSLEDNLPNLMLESMSCGTPVVGFSIGGIKETVINGETGYLSHRGDSRGLANNIKKVLNIGLDGDKCRKYILENHEQHLQGNRYKDLYSDVVKQKSVYCIDNIPCISPELSHSLVKYICDISVEMQNEYNVLESDNEKRLIIINDLSERLIKSDADRKERLEKINYLQERLKESDADRQARLHVIEELEKRLKESDADRRDRLRIIDEIKDKLNVKEEYINMMEEKIKNKEHHWLSGLIKGKGEKG